MDEAIITVLPFSAIYIVLAIGTLLHLATRGIGKLQNISLCFTKIRKRRDKLTLLKSSFLFVIELMSKSLTRGLTLLLS